MMVKEYFLQLSARFKSESYIPLVNEETFYSTARILIKTQNTVLSIMARSAGIFKNRKVMHKAMSSTVDTLKPTSVLFFLLSSPPNLVFQIFPFFILQHG